MNATDRKALAALVTQAEELVSKLDDLHGEADTMASDEESKYDNMSEGLQQGERGQAIEAAKDGLAEMRDSLEQARDSLQEAIDKGNELSQA